MVKTKTVWARSKSGASLRIDSYKYRITSAKVIGRKKYTKGWMYKYQLRYVPRK